MAFLASATMGISTTILREIEAGSIRDFYILNTFSDSTIAFSQLQEMMKRPIDQRPTAIFCSNDKIAIHVINGLNKLGFLVPQDVSVVGFDNLKNYSTSYRGPRVTSIQQPFYQIGYDSIQVIDGILKDQLIAPINRSYSTMLVEHETVAVVKEEGVLGV